MTSCCYLGLWLNETMFWDEHIQYFISKTQCPLNVLKRLSNFFNRGMKLALYRTQLDEYANVVLTQSFKSVRLSSLRPYCIALMHIAIQRLVTHQRLLSESGFFDPLEIRRKYLSLCHMYKIAICRTV